MWWWPEQFLDSFCEDYTFTKHKLKTSTPTNPEVFSKPTHHYTSSSLLKEDAVSILWVQRARFTPTRSQHVTREQQTAHSDGTYLNTDRPKQKPRGVTAGARRGPRLTTNHFQRQHTHMDTQSSHKKSYQSHIEWDPTSFLCYSSWRRKKLLPLIKSVRTPLNVECFLPGLNVVYGIKFIFMWSQHNVNVHKAIISWANRSPSRVHEHHMMHTEACARDKAWEKSVFAYGTLPVRPEPR